MFTIHVLRPWHLNKGTIDHLILQIRVQFCSTAAVKSKTHVCQHCIQRLITRFDTVWVHQISIVCFLTVFYFIVCLCWFIASLGAIRKLKSLKTLSHLKRENVMRRGTALFIVFFFFFHKRASPFSVENIQLLSFGYKILFVHSDYQHRRFSALAIFLQIKEFLIKIRKDWSFLLIPWSVRVTKPLEPRKQTELMCRNYAPLLRLLRGSVQALVSATSAGSRGLLFFLDQWACPCQGF